MIDKEELIEYAKKTDLNLGQAEKDYFQNVLLFIISKEYANKLIFKGGTALKKCYSLNRFSEDLDFNANEDIELEKLTQGIKRFNLDFEMEKQEYERGKKIILKIKGPLFNGDNRSKCRIEIDISFRENLNLNPETKTLGRFLEEIPSFSILVMQEKEILAEKIRAIITRDYARDVYDLFFLLESQISFDKALIEKKLNYYNEKWNLNKFIKSLSKKQLIWKSELEPLIKEVPDFKEVKKTILEKIK
ncbi:MAG: nucleotidyl transferase AbiEii/AbiGii toxin family protein [Candidatus Nanoarchaeia archaeon]